MEGGDDCRPIFEFAMNVLINLLLCVHVLVCLLIVLAVLMQRPKSEGLGGALGGGMTESLFGAQSSNVISTATRWLGILFFVLTITLSILYARQGRSGSGVQKMLNEAAKAAQPALPGTAPALPVVDGVAPVPAGEDGAKAAEGNKPVESQKVSEPVAPAAPVTPKVEAEVPAPAAPATPVAPAAPAAPAPEASAASAAKVPEGAQDASKPAEAPLIPVLKESALELNPAAPAPQNAGATGQ